MAGRQVFLKICATCHQAEGQGFDVGPNLATVANRSPEDLLIHVLDPNREVAPTFVNYNVALVDGRVASGIIAFESASAITLKRAQGAIDSVARDQISTIAATGVSLMPEGLEKELSHKDLANLIALYPLDPSTGGESTDTPAVLTPKMTIDFELESKTLATKEGRTCVRPFVIDTYRGHWLTTFARSGAAARTLDPSVR